MPKKGEARSKAGRKGTRIALSGLEQGEVIAVPSLPEKADWDAFENARNALKPNLSRELPAPRYKVAVKAA